MKELINNTLPPVMGIIGVVLGILLTKLLERNDSREKEKKEVRSELIKKMEVVLRGMNWIEMVIVIIRDFIRFDDYNKETRQKRAIEVIIKLAGIDLEEVKNSWKSISKDVYLYLIKTVQCKYFNEFEGLITDILNSINVTEKSVDGMDKLSERDITEFEYGLVCAPYVLMIMRMEFRSIIGGEKVFYKDEEKKRKKEIQKYIKRNK